MFGADTKTQDRKLLRAFSAYKPPHGHNSIFGQPFYRVGPTKERGKFAGSIFAPARSTFRLSLALEQILDSRFLAAPKGVSHREVANQSRRSLVSLRTPIRMQM